MNHENVGLADAFRASARKHAGQALVWTADAEVTFAEVDRASDRVATALRDAGIVPGDRVALYCINDPSFVQAYLGIQKAGAVVVPVNLLIGAEEIAYILGDAGARALIYHQAMADKVAGFRQSVIV